MAENVVEVEINSRFNDSGVQKALQAVSKLERVFENSFKQFNFPDMGKQFKDMFKQFESVDPTKAMTKLELFDQQTIADQYKSRISLQESLGKARIIIAKRVEKNLVKSEEKIQKGFNDSDKALSNFGMKMLGVGFFAKMLSMEMQNLFQEQTNVTGISLKMAKAVGGGLFDSLNEATASSQLFGMALLNDATPSIETNLDWVGKLQEGYEDLPEPIRDIIGNMAGFITVFGDTVSMLAFTILGLISLGLAFGKVILSSIKTYKAINVFVKSSALLEAWGLSSMGSLFIAGIAIVAIGILIYGLYDIVQVYLGNKIPSETNVVAQAFFKLGLWIADVIQKISTGIISFSLKFIIAINKALISWQEFKNSMGGDIFGKGSAKITEYMNNINGLEKMQEEMRNKTIAWNEYHADELAKFSNESDKVTTEPNANPLSNVNNSTSENNITVYSYDNPQINDFLNNVVTQANNLASKQTDYGATI